MTFRMLKAADPRQIAITATALITNNGHGSLNASWVRPLSNSPQVEAAPTPSP